MVGFFEPGSYPWASRGIPGDAEFTRLPEDWDHLGPFYEQMIEAAAGPGRDRHPARTSAALRASPRTACTTSARRRAAQLLRRGGLQLGRLPERTRRRLGAGRLDRGRALAARPARGRSPPVRPARDQPPLPRAARHRDAGSGRTRSTGPTSSGPARAGCAAARCTTGWRRPERCSASCSAGNAPTGTPRRGCRGGTSTRSGGRTGSGTRRPSTGLCVKAPGLFDTSSFGKLLVQGRDALAVLQRISAGNVAVEPGRIVYTQWLNALGGIESDVTVTRLDETRFLVLSGPATLARDRDWLERRHRARTSSPSSPTSAPRSR